MSSKFGWVKGWCFATYLFSSLSYSNKGNSTTHKRLGSFVFISFNFLASSHLSAPRLSNTIWLSSLATINIKSPFSTFSLSLIEFISDSDKNFS